MSKLAHSHQPTMDEIDRKRAIRDGNEDLIPAGHRAPRPLPYLDNEPSVSISERANDRAVWGES